MGADMRSAKAIVQAIVRDHQPARGICLDLTGRNATLACAIAGASETVGYRIEADAADGKRLDEEQIDGRPVSVNSKEQLNRLPPASRTPAADRLPPAA